MYDSVQKIHALFRTAHISARVEHAGIVRSSQFINRHWEGNDLSSCRLLDSSDLRKELEMPTPRARAAPVPNALIAALPARDRAIVQKYSEPAELALGDVLCEPGSPITHVYFPVSSYISLITPEDVVGSLEVGLIGREGVFGITMMLEVHESPLRALVQGPGGALRMSASSFRKAAATSAPFRRLLNRYLYVLMAQIALSAACGRFHVLDARLARWLLMTHDRAGSNTFPVTHEFLAFMLGVRRAGVTIAAGRLQQLNLIRYSRGRIQILDRKGLEAVSCPCYAEQVRIYRARMGSLRRTRVSPTADVRALVGNEPL